MGTLEFTIPDEIEEWFRQSAMERFGHRRESIEKAGEEALSIWIAEQNIDGKIIG